MVVPGTPRDSLHIRHSGVDHRGQPDVARLGHQQRHHRRGRILHPGRAVAEVDEGVRGARSRRAPRTRGPAGRSSGASSRPAGAAMSGTPARRAGRRSASPARPPGHHHRRGPSGPAPRNGCRCRSWPRSARPAPGLTDTPAERDRTARCGHGAPDLRLSTLRLRRELLGGRLCERCTLADRLTALLHDGTGRVRPEPTPLFDLLVAMDKPRSGPARPALRRDQPGNAPERLRQLGLGRVRQEERLGLRQGSERPAEPGGTTSRRWSRGTGGTTRC